MKIGDLVTIDDPLSMNDDCTGTITDITDEYIYAGLSLATDLFLGMNLNI